MITLHTTTTNGDDVDDDGKVLYCSGGQCAQALDYTPGEVIVAFGITAHEHCKRT